MKLVETEKNSEMEVLKIRKEKLIAERDVIKHKIEEVRAESHMIMTSLIKSQKSLVAKLTTHTKLLGCHLMAVKIERMKIIHLKRIFENLNIYVRFVKRIKQGLNRIKTAFTNIQSRHISSILGLMHKATLNFTKENTLNTKLLEIKINRMKVQSLWLKWREKTKIRQVKR